MIGKNILHYKIIEKLGEGGMGVVYKAEDSKLGRFVALKFLPQQLGQSKEQKQRFMHEAKAASALDHNNVCTVYEIGETEDGQMFIAMACYEGEALKDKIERGPLPIDEAINIAKQIARGLTQAHSKEIIHRDIKSANILVTQDGVVKIVDFGLAKFAGSTMLTKEGTTLGTASYMSPEQTQGTGVDQRTDIWSLGVVLYEMLTGKQPFQGEYEQAVLYSILHKAPEPITGLRTGVPMELERIVNKSLAKKPDERYQRVDEMLVDLKNLKKAEQGGVSESAHPSESTANTVSNRRRFYGSIGVVLAAALLLSLLWGIFKPQPESQPASIAVLPFKNLNRESSQEYFSDGMTETIISDLANISGLTVISRTSVMAYKNSEKNIREIGQELNVSHILEGSILSSGEKVRIFAQLIDAKTDANLWAQTYDREITDIFSIQSDVANQIAAVLTIALKTDARTRIERRPTTDFEAYRLFLKGEFHFRKQSLTGTDTSIVLYEQAIERDAEFAMAYAALASAYLWKSLSFDPNPKWEEKAYVAVQQALSLDPQLAEAHAVQGLIFWSPSNNFAHEDALKEFKMAIILKPGLSTAHQQLSLVQLHIGLLDKALITGRKSVELDPGNHRARNFVGEVLLFQGKYTESLEVFRDLPGTFAPSLTVSLTALNLFYLNRMDEAVALIEQKLLESPNDPQFNSVCSIFLASLGRKGEAREKMKLALENALAYIHIHHIYHNLAAAAALMGENHEAVEWLVKTAEKGFPNYPLFNRDPNLASLKGDPDFETFMTEMKKKWGYYKTL